MKSVLMLAHDDAGQEARLAAALSLTRLFDGHLTCIDVAVPPAVAMTPGADLAGGVSLGLSAQLFTDEIDRERSNVADLGARLVRDGVRHDCMALTGDTAAALMSRANLSDIVVIDLPDTRDLAPTLAKEAGAPVLAVPQGRAFDPHGHAMVGWDGSPAAGAALRQAVSLLRHAARVTIVSVGDAVACGASDAAAYLHRHGIAAEVLGVEAAGRRPSAALLETARELGASYLVMGCYGRARWREALFGGTTRALLEQADLPLLLAR